MIVGRGYPPDHLTHDGVMFLEIESGPGQTGSVGRGELAV